MYYHDRKIRVELMFGKVVEVAPLDSANGRAKRKNEGRSSGEAKGGILEWR